MSDSSNKWEKEDKHSSKRNCAAIFCDLVILCYFFLTHKHLAFFRLIQKM